MSDFTNRSVTWRLYQDPLVQYLPPRSTPEGDRIRKALSPKVVPISKRLA